MVQAESLAAECYCSPVSYVSYKIEGDFELHEMPWEVVSALHAIDLQDPMEPERCFVTLRISTHYYIDNWVPEGEFAIFDGRVWGFGGDFEVQMEETGCQLVVSE
jgi:hypothetical protein